MPFPILLPREMTYNRTPRWSDVYWFDFGHARSNYDKSIAEPHLAIIVSNTRITLPGTALIVPMSGAEHKKPSYPFHVLIKKDEYPKFEKDGIAKVDQVYCVSTTELPDQYYLTTLKKDTIRPVYEQLLRVLNVKEFL